MNEWDFDILYRWLEHSYRRDAEFDLMSLKVQLRSKTELLFRFRLNPRKYTISTGKFPTTGAATVLCFFFQWIKWHQFKSKLGGILSRDTEQLTAKIKPETHSNALQRQSFISITILWFVYFSSWCYIYRERHNEFSQTNSYGYGPVFLPVADDEKQCT